jgi:hypothetical protein
MIYEPMMLSKESLFRKANLYDDEDTTMEYRLYCKENNNIIRIFYNPEILNSFSFCIQNIGGPDDNVMLKNPSKKYSVVINENFENKYDWIENVNNFLIYCLGIKINNTLKSEEI